MRVLLVCNLALPQIALKENLAANFGGGWIVGLSESLINTNGIELTVCFPDAKKNVSENSVPSYFSFNPASAKEDFLNIISNTKPDVIHIFGTEYKHTLDCVNACEELGVSDKVIINIQGLVSVISKHYTVGLPHNVLRKKTLRDFIKRVNIYKGVKAFEKRGKNEIAALKKVKHIVGRTDWDKACTSWINPDADYHFCNETLRSEFYKHKWNYDACEKHSIFVSQCSYPIKGFHYVLEAMPMILSKYPDAKLYTTGKDIINIKGMDKLRMTYYQVYLRKLIRKYGIEDKVLFLGALDEKAMCDRYLKANVFVSASTIENESNSVSEAMLLGTPVVSSFVGGITNRLRHNIDGYMYQLDAPYMLAYYICELFEKRGSVETFSVSEREHALQIVDRETNLSTMLEIYKKVSG